MCLRGQLTAVVTACVPPCAGEGPRSGQRPAQSDGVHALGSVDGRPGVHGTEGCKALDGSRQASLEKSDLVFADIILIIASERWREAEAAKKK